MLPFSVLCKPLKRIHEYRTGIIFTTVIKTQIQQASPQTLQIWHFISWLRARVVHLSALEQVCLCTWKILTSASIVCFVFVQPQDRKAEHSELCPLCRCRSRCFLFTTEGVTPIYCACHQYKFLSVHVFLVVCMYMCACVCVCVWCSGPLPNSGSVCLTSLWLQRKRLEWYFDWKYPVTDHYPEKQGLNWGYNPKEHMVAEEIGGNKTAQTYTVCK